jgi:hypothetical protein
MSKSAKPVLLYLIFLLITVVGLVISVVVLKISYEQLLMKKDKTQKELIVTVQEQKKLNVIYQDLISEDNIIPFAENNLMLVRNFNSVAQIKINNEQIKLLEETLNRKYE